ncbi:RAVE 1 carboxy-terminal protein, partial [Gregarina niphandrodes]
LPVNGVGILPFNATEGLASGLPESSQRVHPSRLQCRASLGLSASATRLLGVEDIDPHGFYSMGSSQALGSSMVLGSNGAHTAAGTNPMGSNPAVLSGNVSGSASGNVSGGAHPLVGGSHPILSAWSQSHRESCVDVSSTRTALVAGSLTRKGDPRRPLSSEQITVKSNTNDFHWLLAAVDPNLGLPSFVRESLANVQNPQSVCLRAKWNFLQAMAPLRVQGTFSSSGAAPLQSSIQRRMKVLDPRESWQKLTPYVDAVCLDTLGSAVVKYKASACEAIGLPPESVVDLSSLTEDGLHIPLQYLVEVPLDGNDAPYQLFLAVTAGDRKLIAFTLAMDIRCRVVVNAALLLGRNVIQSLLSCVSTTFHPSTIHKDRACEVNSNILSMHVSKTHHRKDTSVRLVLHLGVSVDNTEEEQVLITSFAVSSPTEPDLHGQYPCTLVFDKSSLDIYLDYCRPYLLGIPSKNLFDGQGTLEAGLPGNIRDDTNGQTDTLPMCILDLPTMEECPNHNHDVKNDEHELNASLINSCVRYFSDSAWNSFDLLASFPVLEEPGVNQPDPVPRQSTLLHYIVEDEPRRDPEDTADQGKYAGSFLPFKVPLPMDTPSLVAGVYALSFSPRTHEPVLVPYFLARIPIWKRDAINKASNEVEEGGKTPVSVRSMSSIPFVMDMELSSRTLAILCSNAALYIFEYRSSFACRDQHDLLSNELGRLAAGRGPAGNGYIQPHLAVQVIHLDDYITKTCRSVAEHVQLKAARYLATLALGAAKTEDRVAEADKKRVVTPWQKVANSLRFGSRHGSRTGPATSGSLRGTSGSVRGTSGSVRGTKSNASFGSKTLSSTSLSLPAGPQPGNHVLVRVTGADLSRWMCVDTYCSPRQLLSFYSPCHFSMSRSPEILLLNWPEVHVLPAPPLLHRYQSLITPARPSLKNPTTVTWLPVPSMRPFVVTSMPVADGLRPEQAAKCKSVPNVGMDGFRQGTECSGLIWKAIPLHTLVHHADISDHALPERQQSGLPPLLPARGPPAAGGPRFSGLGLNAPEKETGTSDRSFAHISAQSHFHCVQWAGDSPLIPSGEQIRLPVLVSYSTGGILNEQLVRKVYVDVPSATSKVITLEHRNGPGPKQIHHPDVLWMWLRTGHVALVLWVLRGLYEISCYHFQSETEDMSTSLHRYGTPQDAQLISKLLRLPTMEVLMARKKVAADFKPAAAGGGGGRAAELFENAASLSDDDIFGHDDDESDDDAGHLLLDDLLHGAEYPRSDSGEVGAGNRTGDLGGHPSTSTGPTRGGLPDSGLAGLSPELTGESSMIADMVAEGGRPSPQPSESGAAEGSPKTPGAAKSKSQKEFISTAELEELRYRLKHLLRRAQHLDQGGDLKGWRLILDISGVEMIRLLGLIDFVLARKLAENATLCGLTPEAFSTGADTGFYPGTRDDGSDTGFESEAGLMELAERSWLALHASVTGQEMEAVCTMDLLASTLFLVAVSRSSFSIGDWGEGEDRQKLTEDLKLQLEPQRSMSTDELCLGLIVQDQRLLLREAIVMRNRGRALDPGRPMTWEDMASVGAGYWLASPEILREVLDALPRSQYLHEMSLDHESERDQRVLEKVAVLYCLAGKHLTLAGLYQKAKNQTVSEFLRNDFAEERWMISARKNAWQLILKKRYVLALAFFVLGRSGQDVVDICVRYLHDCQLASFLARCYDLNILQDASYPTVNYMVRQKLLPAADENQDLSLTMFCRSLLESPSSPQRLLRSGDARIIDPESAFENKAATVAQLVPSQQQPSWHGYVLGSEVCLRRFSSFSACPNVLSCLLASLPSYPLRDIPLLQSTLRSITEALSRRHFIFSVFLLAFLNRNYEKYMNRVPDYVLQAMISQWYALQCSEVIGQYRSENLRDILGKWLDLHQVQDAAAGDRNPWFSEPLFSPKLLQMFQLLKEEGVPLTQTYPLVGSTWSKMFGSAQEYSKLLLLIETLPKAVVLTILKQSSRRTNVKDTLSLSSIDSPLLRRLFPLAGDPRSVNYAEFREHYHTTNVLGCSVDSMLQMHDAESIIIGTVNVLCTILYAVLDDFTHVRQSQLRVLASVTLQLTLLHLMQTKYLHEDVFLNPTNGQALWTLAYCIMLTVLGASIAAFETLFGVLNGYCVTDASATIEACEDGWLLLGDEASQLKVCRGISRLHTLAATIKGRGITPTTARACVSAMLLTITQDIYFCTLDDDSQTGGVVHEESAEFRNNILKQLRHVVLQYVCLGSCETILEHLRTLNTWSSELHPEPFDPLIPQYNSIKGVLAKFCAGTYQKAVRRNLEYILIQLTAGEFRALSRRLSGSPGTAWVGIILRSDVLKLCQLCDPSPKMKEVIRKIELTSELVNTNLSAYVVTSLTREQSSTGHTEASSNQASALTTAGDRAADRTADRTGPFGTNERTGELSQGGSESLTITTFGTGAKGHNNLYAVNMCAIQYQIPLTRNSNSQVLWPYLGTPGALTLPFQTRSFLPFIAVATNRGLQVLNLTGIDFMDPLDLLAYNADLLSPMLGVIARSSLNGMHSAWWRTYILNASERQRMKIISRVQDTLPASHGGGTVPEFANPALAQITGITPHPCVSVLAGIIAKPETIEGGEMHAVVSLFGVAPSRKTGDCSYLGCLCLPSEDNVSTVLTNRHTLDRSERSLAVERSNGTTNSERISPKSSGGTTAVPDQKASDRGPSDQKPLDRGPMESNPRVSDPRVSDPRVSDRRVSEGKHVGMKLPARSSLKNPSAQAGAAASLGAGPRASGGLMSSAGLGSASGTAGVRTEGLMLPTASRRTSATASQFVTHHASATVSAGTAGDLLALRWSREDLWAASEKGYVFAWKLFHDAANTVQIRSGETLVVGRALPLLTLHAHTSARFVEPIPVEHGRLLFVTGGKGVGSVQRIYAHLAREEDSAISSVTGAVPAAANQLQVVGNKVQALSEHQASSLPEFAAAMREAAGALLVWTNFMSIPGSAVPMLRPSVLLADLAYCANDHPTGVVWWPAERAVIYGTVSGCLRLLNFDRRTVTCLKGRDTRWPCHLFICPLTNRLIVVWCDCSITVYDLTRKRPNDALLLLLEKEGCSPPAPQRHHWLQPAHTKLQATLSNAIYIPPNAVLLLNTAGQLLRTRI